MWPWLVLSSIFGLFVVNKGEKGSGESSADYIWAQHVKDYWKPLSQSEQYQFSASGLLVSDFARASWKPYLEAYLLPKPTESSLWFFYRPSENLFYVLR